MEFIKNVTLNHAAFGEGETVQVYKSNYMNNDSTALFAKTEYGEPWGALTINLDQLPVEGYVFIKDYSENEGVMQDLIDAEIIEAPKHYVAAGFVNVPMCKLLV